MAVAMKYGSGNGGRNTGVTMTLLWTNPDPTSSFAAQTVSVDLSGYDAIEIVGTGGVQTPRLFINKMLVDGNNWAMFSVSGASSYYYNRHVDVLTTGLTFSTGYRNGTAGTGYCIPLKIYGIKGIS